MVAREMPQPHSNRSPLSREGRGRDAGVEDFVAKRPECDQHEFVVGRGYLEQLWNSPQIAIPRRAFTATRARSALTPNIVNT